MSQSQRSVANHLGDSSLLSEWQLLNRTWYYWLFLSPCLLGLRLCSSDFNRRIIY